MNYNQWQDRNWAQQQWANLVKLEAVQKAKPFMAYGGAALILIGAMVPDLNIGLAADMKLNQNNFNIGGVQTWNLSSTSLGFIVMGIAIAAMFFNYKGEDNSLRWSGVAALVLSAYLYFNMISDMAQWGELMTGFGMLDKEGLYISTPWSFAWGTVLLLLGVAMVVAASFVEGAV
jgi:hypothetical protein